MSQRAKKRVVESDAESEEDMFDLIEERHQADDDVENGSEHGKHFEIQTKLALVNRIKEINKRRSISHKVAIKHLDWSQLNVEGLDEDEAKECFNQIISPVNTIRTLDEMLNDYRENYQKYELKNALHAPKLPQNPVMRYIQEHRAELEKKMIKKNPTERIKLGSVSKFGAKRYHKLPEEEKDRYKREYKIALDEYHKQRSELIRLNPELKKPRKKYDSAPAARKKKSADDKSETMITPFRLFLRELKEKNPEIRYQEAQAQYKNLGDHEKLSYINKVLYLETELDKIFTADEKKIMKHSSGMPVKPLSAYNAFVQSKTKNANFGKGKSSVKVISELWKTATDEEKKVYEKKFQADLDQWKEAMMVWIKTLPLDQRAEQIAKHKLFDSNKRKRDESMLSPEDMEIKIENEGFENVIEIAQIEEDRQKSPKKKRLNSESEGLSSPSGSKKNQTAIDWDTVFDTNKTSSPKKENIEKQLAALGEYPSLTTAHYFMKTKGEGKGLKKLAKAYKELTRAEKRKLFIEMLQAKNAYMSKMKSFALKLDPKHNSKVIAFHHSNKEQQDKSVSWHTASGTDISSESSSDEDDDSDES